MRLIIGCALVALCLAEHHTDPLSDKQHFKVNMKYLTLLVDKINYHGKSKKKGNKNQIKFREKSMIRSLIMKPSWERILLLNSMNWRQRSRRNVWGWFFDRFIISTIKIWENENFRKLIPKMDSNDDGFIEENELKDHINFMQKRYLENFT